MTPTPSTTNPPAPRYLVPDRATRSIVNPAINTLTKLGLSVRGSRTLRVPGRVTGAIQSVPVNVLSLDGERYLVAPRGNTQWVRNVRAAGGCELRVGRRIEAVHVDELDDDAKPPVLRAYLHQWKREVGKFFEGVDVDATDDELLAVAGGYPVFRLTTGR